LATIISFAKNIKAPDDKSLDANIKKRGILGSPEKVQTFQKKFCFGSFQRFTLFLKPNSSGGKQIKQSAPKVW